MCPREAVPRQHNGKQVLKTNVILRLDRRNSMSNYKPGQKATSLALMLAFMMYGCAAAQRLTCIDGDCNSGPGVENLSMANQLEFLTLFLVIQIVHKILILHLIVGLVLYRAGEMQMVYAVQSATR
jgi:hypothetical protein